MKNQIVIGYDNPELSKYFLSYMEKLGCKRAKKLLNLGKIITINNFKRHDPHLLQATKDLQNQQLAIKNFEGNQYRIITKKNEWDSVETPKDIKFITIFSYH